MLTNIKQTSINAFHDVDNKATQHSQRQQVAAFIIAQTKAGKPTCRAAIAEHFAAKGNFPLSQKSTVSARVNELAEGIQIGGISYEFKVIEDRKHTPHDRCAVEHFCLIRANLAPVQIELFQ